MPSLLDRIRAIFKTNKDKIRIQDLSKENFMSLLESDPTFLTNFSLKDLLKKDSLNKTYLEYACEKKVEFPDDIKEKIKNNAEALYICAKNDHFSWVKDIKNEKVFDKIVNGERLYHVIVKRNLCSEEFVRSFKNPVYLIHSLIENGCDTSFLPDEIALNFFNSRLGGTRVFDEYIVRVQGYNSNSLAGIVTKIPVPVLLKYLNKKRMNVLLYCSEEQLMTKLDDSRTLLNFALDNKINPLFCNSNIKQKETLDILLKRVGIRYFYRTSLDLLLTIHQNNQTYLDEMIKLYKEKRVEMHFDFMLQKYFNYEPEVIARFLTIMYDSSLIGFVTNLDSKMLLYKGKNEKETVVEHLIKIDRAKAREIIFEASDLDNPNFVIYLRSLGIEVSGAKLRDEETSYRDTLIADFNKKYAPEGELHPLLEELRELFYQDGKSEKTYVDALITAYKYLLTKDPELALKEINQLLAIKKKYPTVFIYLKTKNRSCFNGATGEIYLTNANIGTVIHETTHLFHLYLANDDIPDDFVKLLDEIRKNPSVLEGTRRYSDDYYAALVKLMESLPIDKIHRECEEKYSGEKRKDLEKFLSSSLEEKKKEVEGKFPPEVLDVILSKTYSVEEFIARRKQIEVNEASDAMTRNELMGLAAMGDILDGIFQGKLRSCVLFDKNGQVIEGAYGHGIEYYSYYQQVFQEMLANYAVIMKAKNSQELLSYLRSIVGDKLVDMLSDFYHNKMLNSRNITERYEMSTGKKI